MPPAQLLMQASKGATNAGHRHVRSSAAASRNPECSPPPACAVGGAISLCNAVRLNTFFRGRRCGLRSVDGCRHEVPPPKPRDQMVGVSCRMSCPAVCVYTHVQRRPRLLQQRIRLDLGRVGRPELRDQLA